MDEEDDDCVYVWGDDSDLDYTSTSSSDSEEDDGFEYYAQFSGGKPMPTREEQKSALYRADASRRRQSSSHSAMLLPSGFGRTLCLHYYSNIAVDLLPSENEEVYPLYSIKDWNDISIHWMDTFCEKENVKGRILTSKKTLNKYPITTFLLIDK